MRVATLNLLHGVPLRDRATGQTSSDDDGEDTDTGSGRGARTGSGRGAGRRGKRLSGTKSGRPSRSEAADDVRPGPVAASRARIEDAPDDTSAHDPVTAAAVAAAQEGVEPTERNLWSPIASDPADLIRAIEELMESGPIDVIALQEVDRAQPRTAGVDQARLVAETIGAKYWRFVPSVRGTPGIAAEGAAWVPATAADDLPGDEPEPRRPARGGPRYGIALISRYPVRGWRVMRFPPAPVSMPLLAPSEGRPRPVRVPDEPRAAAAAIIELPYADVTVATAHLSFVPGVNTKQLNGLRAFVAGMPRPMILMGDFNTPGGIPGLVTGWDQVARIPTYPVLRPRIQFDHVMADGWTAEALHAARASAHALALPISDHRALIVDFPDP